MPDRIDAHLGRRLRQRRWFLGLTQSQVGDRVNIKFQQVQKYETGQNRISASRLWELAQALDVPVAYFYEGLSSTDDAEAAGAPAESRIAAEAAATSARLSAAAPTDGAAEPAPRSGGSDAPALGDRETVDLLRAYQMLPPTPRRRLLDLVRALSRLEMREPGKPSEPAEGPLRRRAG